MQFIRIVHDLMSDVRSFTLSAESVNLPKCPKLSSSRIRSSYTFHMHLHG